MKPKLIVVLFFTLSTMAGQNVPTASLQGEVLRAGANQPIANARVTVENVDAKTSVITTTDAAGKFVVEGMEPGAYRLTIAARGYAQQTFGQRVAGGTWTPIELAGGQAVKDLKLYLTPGGSIEGRVRDNKGNPAFGVPISLLLAAYDNEGKKTFASVVSVETDDRGEYRLFWIAPGSYYLRAGGRIPISSGLTLDGGTVSPFGEVFYPGTSTAESASPIQIRAGADLQAMDFQVDRQNLLRIRGRVVDITGSSPTNALIAVVGDTWSTGGGNLYDRTNGTFEIAGLWPGTYRILSSLTEPGNGRIRTVSASESVTVRLIDKDIEGLVLRIPSVASLSGHVRFSGIVPQGLSVRLENLDTAMLRMTVPGTMLGPIGIDGSFTIPEVFLGSYQVTLSDPSYYVKQAHYGVVDVTDNPLKFEGGNLFALEVQVGRSIGQVSGVVKDSQLRPVAGARVVLVAERGRFRRDAFREITSDARGRYSFTNVRPGDYKLYAWEANSGRDPEILKKFDRNSRSVHVDETSNQTIDTTLIPAEGL